MIESVGVVPGSGLTREGQASAAGAWFVSVLPFEFYPGVPAEDRLL